MGSKGTKDNLNLTEAKIQESLKSILSQPRFLLKNLYVFGWESDLLFLTKSGYWYEYEIKISRADFKNDFKHKNDKHIKVLQNIENTRKPNYFYYAVPENMISVDEVPEYAGLIYVTEHGNLKTIKQAPKLHKEKIDPNKLNLVDKFYYNMVNAKIDAKNNKIYYKRLQEKYSDMSAVENINQNIGFEKCFNLAVKSYRENCSSFIKGSDFSDNVCIKYPNNRKIFSNYRCYCDDMMRFTNNIT